MTAAEDLLAPLLPPGGGRTETGAAGGEAGGRNPDATVRLRASRASVRELVKKRAPFVLVSKTA